MPSKNYRGVADRVDVFSAAAPVVSSTAVVENNWAGFPITSAAAGSPYTMHVEGEFEVEMVVSAAQGDVIYVEPVAGALSLTAPAGAGGTPAVNETQNIDYTATVSGGTFTLTFDGETTTALDWDSTAGEVQTALEALSNLAPGDVVITLGPGPADMLATFGGNYAGVDVPLMVADDASITGGGTVIVTAGTAGVPEVPAGPSAGREFGKVTRIAGDNGVATGKMWLKISPYKHS